MENQTKVQQSTVNQSTSQPTNQMQNQMSVPNSTGVLVLGILSIVFFWCFGIVGAVMGIIALVLSKSAFNSYNENPSNYTQASFNNLKAGKICAIIGLILGGLVMLYYLVILIFVGSVGAGILNSL